MRIHIKQTNLLLYYSDVDYHAFLLNVILNDGWIDDIRGYETPKNTWTFVWVSYNNQRLLGFSIRKL